MPENEAALFRWLDANRHVLHDEPTPWTVADGRRLHLAMLGAGFDQEGLAAALSVPAEVIHEAQDGRMPEEHRDAVEAWLALPEDRRAQTPRMGIVDPEPPRGYVRHAFWRSDPEMLLAGIRKQLSLVEAVLDGAKRRGDNDPSCALAAAALPRLLEAAARTSKPELRRVLSESRDTVLKVLAS